MADAPTNEDIAGVCVDAGGSALGMPQLCTDWMGNQVFWLVITLVAIFLILSRVALPRIAAILAERQGTITNDLTRAEDLKQQAVAAEEAYKKALAEARAEAQTIVAQTRAEIAADLAEATEKADAEIAAKSAESEKAISEIRATAMENVSVVARDTAAAIVEALGGKADESAIDSAVSSRVKG
jgi:F-type H+-transporting ATPase subunit b